ncbi:MAG: pyridoxal phosphate-dependent aminotransferase [Rubricoccaceae bacterium]|nr:pyridoxal phosphate-dependent aminotransferase [Rubricoccaceae bacterium]
MSVSRLHHIPGFSIDRVAAAVGNDPDVLRLENLDTDLAPPQAALVATRDALESLSNPRTRTGANSYLPFSGDDDLRAHVARRVNQDAGTAYTSENVVITCGATEGMLDALLAMTNPGDEVILTDPTYAGMIYRARLVGCTTRFVPFYSEKGPEGKAWRLDLDALRAAITRRTRVVFLMNPSVPTGAVLSEGEWQAVSEICCEHGVWLLYNAAMERILYDDRPLIHPAGFEDMPERTVTVGSVSKEFRMIGWRIGWVIAPFSLVEDIKRVHIYNVVTPTGISQPGACAALSTTGDRLEDVVSVWQQRRDVVSEQLEAYGSIPAAGGWSQLLDVDMLGFDSFKASRLLLERGLVAATPMRDWGENNGNRFVRIVFSNEPVERLSLLGERVRLALGEPVA